MSSGFQVAASALPQGNESEVAPSDMFTPRAPDGPSLSTRPGTPLSGSAALCQRSAPALSAAFSSSVSFRRISSTRAVRPASLAFGSLGAPPALAASLGTALAPLSAIAAAIVSRGEACGAGLELDAQRVRGERDRMVEAGERDQLDELRGRELGGELGPERVV